jgi:RNA polymerase sigma-70 factor (ECF subfamily)
MVHGETMLSLLLTFPDIPEEDRLLAQAQQGNHTAITKIYEAYFEPIYQFIRWRVDDPGQAEDLTSEVFIKFLNALQSPSAPRHSLRGWMFRVARNVLYDHYQQPDMSSELDETLAAPDDAEGMLVRQLDAESLRAALRTLAADQQEVLILRFGQTLSLEDTAASMGRSVSAIKSLQFRAINALRRSLGKSAEETGYGIL